MIKKALAVDIGGTTTQIAVIRDDGTILSNKNIATKPLSGGQDIANRISKEINSITKIHNDVLGIGIGTAGQIYNGSIIAATDTFKDWIGFDLQKEIQKQSGFEVRVINDVNAMLLGERMISKGLENTVAFAIGTGVGGAIFSNGNLITGHNQSAGELGHMILHPNGRRCPCGNRGCVESYLSGPSLEKRYAELSNEKLSSQEIFENNSPMKTFVLNEFLNNLIFSLTSLTNLLSPETIILSGGVSQSLKEYIDYITKQVQSSVLVSNNNVNIIVSDLLSDAMILGSAGQFFE